MTDRLRIVRDFSCGGVVWNAETNQMLVVRVENLAGKKVWTFPKGHPEKEELDEAAALREVQEETGWLCSIEKPLMDIQYSYVHKKNKVNKTVRWFLMSPVKKVGEPQPEEVLECKWIDEDGAKKLLIYESDLKLLKCVSQLV